MYTMPEQAEPARSHGWSGSSHTEARSDRLDLRRIAPTRRRPLLVAAFRALEPEQGFSFLSPCDEREVLTELQRDHGDEVEWFVLEEGPEVWDVVVSRRRLGIRRRQLLDFMRADHCRIDDLMVKVTHQAARGQSEVHTTCRHLATALRRHLRMEEDVLLPVVAERLTGPRPPVVGLSRDHAKIEALLDEMCTVSAAPGPPKARAHELAGIADELESVLLRHIGLEERVLYAVTDLLVTSDERDALVRRCQQT